jgi:hypothetical protein
VGVVRSDPPQVFLANSPDVLSRLLALQLVAQADPEVLDAAGVLDQVREALLEERWADAVFLWIQATNEPVDAYPDEPIWTEHRLDEEKASMEIRMAPIFNEGA